MKRYALVFILGLVAVACLILFYACSRDRPVWQGFHGSPPSGLSTYAAELRTSDVRDGAELRRDALFLAHHKVRYEMKGSTPLEQMILLARLDSGQAWLVNPANNRCLEGSFSPQRWMDIGYLLGAFPGVVRPRILSHSEEILGQETLSGYKASKVRRKGREVLFGEEREFTELFWLAEESCIPLRHEDDTVRSELTNIRAGALADSLFAIPAECRKVSSFTGLLSR